MKRSLHREDFKFSLTTFLSQKMTRREFIQYVGVFIVTTTGVMGLLHNITNPPLRARKTQRKTIDFGSGAYGGYKTNRGGVS